MTHPFSSTVAFECLSSFFLSFLLSSLFLSAPRNLQIYDSSLVLRALSLRHSLDYVSPWFTPARDKGSNNVGYYRGKHATPRGPSRVTYRQRDKCFRRFVRCLMQTFASVFSFSSRREEAARVSAVGLLWLRVSVAFRRSRREWT